MSKSREKQLKGKNNLFLRIIVFYVLTWFFIMLIGGGQQATGIIPSEIGLPQWGPGIAALLMLVIFRKDGFKIAFISKGTPALRYLYATLIALGMGLVVYLIKFLVPMESDSVRGISINLPLTLLWIPLGAIGEEIGWRGYLHQKLNPHMQGLFSSLLVGLFWMPIHVSFLSQSPVFLIFFALMIMSFSVVIYALIQDTGFNVLLAAIFHMAINLTNFLFLDVMFQTSFIVINSLAWVILAGVVVFVKKDLFLGSKQ